MANSLLDPEYLGGVQNALAGLLSAPKRVGNALLDAYQTLTQPHRFDQVAADYIMNTPQRFRDNVNSAFPDPRLLNPNNQTPEAQSARESAANALLNFAAPIVYHGSPHSFTKFDSSKIGTGEGAQAYGHGLYFAEAPDVAKSYQTTLAPDKRATSLNDRMNSLVVGGKPVMDYGVEMNPEFIAAARQGPEAALAHIDERLASWQQNAIDPSYPFKDYAKDKVAGFSALRGDAAKNGVQYTGDGSFYKVDLPDAAAAKMLDWDKPLSQQHPAVQKALAKIEPDMYHPNGSDYDPSELGQMIYSRLSSIAGAPDAATGLLKQAGVPGIRYLDGGSRGAASGTSNYVVFPGNEGLLQILERNGQPVK